MILIHRGKGAAVVLIGGVLSALAMNFITTRLFGDEYYSSHMWPKFGTLWLSGAVFTFAGAYLRKRPTKVKDGDWVNNESADHLFFIPVIYWGPIFFALGIVYVVYSLTKS